MADVTSAAYWLSEIQATADDLAKARVASQSTIGNRQVAMQRIQELIAYMGFCQRQYNATRDASSGAKSPGFKVAKWT